MCAGIDLGIELDEVARAAPREARVRRADRGPGTAASGGSPSAPRSRSTQRACVWCGSRLTTHRTIVVACALAVRDQEVVVGAMKAERAVAVQRRVRAPDLVEPRDHVAQAVRSIEVPRRAADTSRCARAPRRPGAGRAPSARTTGRRCRSCSTASRRAPRAATNAARPPCTRCSGKMSGVVGQKFGRKNSATVGLRSAPRGSASARACVVRHVKYVYDCEKPALASAYISFGRVNASARKIASG